MAPDIDRWVVRASLDMLARHPQQLAHLDSCHINLSGQSIIDGAFVRDAPDNDIHRTFGSRS